MGTRGLGEYNFSTTKSKHLILSWSIINYPTTSSSDDAIFTNSNFVIALFQIEISCVISSSDIKWKLRSACDENILAQNCSPCALPGCRFDTCLFKDFSFLFLCMVKLMHSLRSRLQSHLLVPTLSHSQDTYTLLKVAMPTMSTLEDLVTPNLHTLLHTSWVYDQEH